MQARRLRSQRRHPRIDLRFGVHLLRPLSRGNDVRRSSAEVLILASPVPERLGRLPQDRNVVVGEVVPLDNGAAPSSWLSGHVPFAGR